MPVTRTLRGSYAGGRKESTTDPEATGERGDTAGKPKRGRPIGSKNRPKGLVPAELTEKMLPMLAKQLSPESFEYVEGVIKHGRPIETKRELDVVIAMLARNIIPALINETLPEEAGGSGGQYRKDVTERLKILNSFLTLRHQIEKTQDDGTKPGESVLLKLVGDRNIAGRLGVLVGVQSGVLAGDTDGTGREANDLGAVPDQVPQRPLLGTSGEQVEADRV